jgi:regulator of sigma E protease
LFFLIEAVRGKPLGLRAQEYASRVGMFALLALMLYALTNDIRGLF